MWCATDDRLVRIAVRLHQLVLPLHLLLEISEEIGLRLAMQGETRFIQKEDDILPLCGFTCKYQAMNEKNQTKPRERVPNPVETKCRVS